MGKPGFDVQKWNEYLKYEEMDEVVKSLDKVLFNAVMRYMDKDLGGNTEQDQMDVLNVRCLLEGLRNSITA